MKERMKLGAAAFINLMMGKSANSHLRYKGVWVAECYRKSKLMWREEIENLIVDEGINHALNVEYHAATAITAWYCTLVESDTVAAAGMTYAVPVYTECTAYDEGTRPAYIEAESTAKSITNVASKAVFTISATKTLHGASLVGGGTAADTKGDTAGGGTLSCYAEFAASRAVLDNDVVNLTYEVTGSSS